MYLVCGPLEPSFLHLTPLVSPLHLQSSSEWKLNLCTCLRTVADDHSHHGDRKHDRTSLCGCGPGTDSGLRGLSLFAASSHDYPLCEGHHGPLQCHPHLHLGGTAPWWLTIKSVVPLPCQVEKMSKNRKKEYRLWYAMCYIFTRLAEGASASPKVPSTYFLGFQACKPCFVFLHRIDVNMQRTNEAVR